MIHIHTLLQFLLSLPDPEYKTWLERNAQRLYARIVPQIKAKAERISDHGDLSKALDLLNLTTQVLERANYFCSAQIDPLAMAIVWRGRAAVLQQHEHYQQSVEAAEAAARIYEQYGKPFDVAVARTGQVFSLGALGQFEKAVELGHQIQTQFTESNFSYGLALVTTSLADILTNLWHHNEALAEYNKALNLFLELQEETMAADVLHSMGILFTQMDRLDLAENYYTCAYPTFVAHSKPVMMVRTQFNLAHCYIRQEQYEDALTCIAQARADLQRLPNSPAIGFIDLAEAQVCYKLHQLTQAQVCLRQALDRFEQAQDKLAATEVILDLGRLLAASESPNKRAEGLDYLDQAEIYLQALVDPLFLACVQLEQAELLLQFGRIDEAIPKGEKASKAFEDAGLSLRHAQAQTLLADSYAQTLPSHAQQLYQSILETFDESISLVTVRCWWGLGRLATASDDIGTAEQAYIRAIEVLDLLRRSLRSHSHQAGFLEEKEKRAITEALLATLQAKQGNEQRILTWLEHFKASALADLLTKQPVDQGFDQKLQSLLLERENVAVKIDRHMTALYTNINSHVTSSQQRGRALAAHDNYQIQELAELRQQLQVLDEQIERHRHPANDWREGTTIETQTIHHLIDDASIFVSYYTVNDQLHALTATNNEGDFQIHALSVSLTEIANIWKSTKRLVSLPNEPIAIVQEALATLWQYLIAPLETRLQDKQRLIILPHRELFHIPFASLYDMKNNRYLIQCWTIQIVPSATVLTWCQRRPQTSLPPLLVGYPGISGQEDYLRAVERELKDIAQIFPDATILFDEDATASRVLTEMPRRQFIHLAGHAFFNSAIPLESGMPLAGGRWLRASDLYLRYGHLKGATVILSGCETGRGRMSGGDVLGLISAFLYAGAAGIVAGLWHVDDAATAMLMPIFYRELTKGVDTANALRQAQLSLLKNDNYSAPYFWAPFALNGDSRVLIT